MPIVSIYGHESLRTRLRQSVLRGELPGSILFHGERGIGKQRLALWLGQLLLCEQKEPPCGSCTSCRHVLSLQHPDLYWFYPRARLKDPDPKPGDVLEDYAESHAERLSRHGLYAPPSGAEGIYVATVRTVVQRAVMAPAMGRRKVFILGDAERMVSQEGADQAANAFLKLLEEPLADTTLILTSSEAGRLLPTIRSRVAAFRCAPLAEREIRAFLSDPVVQAVIREINVPTQVDAQVELAAGAPGVLLAGETLGTAMSAARQIIKAVEVGGTELYENALAQGVANARGSFSETLDALQVVLRERTRDAVARGDLPAAAGASRAVDAVMNARGHAYQNVNPQLVTARLLRDLAAVLHA